VGDLAHQRSIIVMTIGVLDGGAEASARPTRSTRVRQSTYWIGITSAPREQCTEALARIRR
jgi:hypothetical protein